MILLKNLAMLSALMLISNCTSTKPSSTGGDSETTSENVVNAQKMMAEGFLRASIISSSMSDDCPFVMKVANEASMLDPVNLETAYMNDGGKIWVKFTRLRMMNRCDNANPVSITDIHKREE